jgi:hypothetical protein
MVFTLRCASVFALATLWPDGDAPADASPEGWGVGAWGRGRPAWVVRPCDPPKALFFLFALARPLVL